MIPQPAGRPQPARHDPDDTAVTPAEAAAMMRAVFALFQRWQVSDREARVLLGQPSERTYYRWKKGEIGSVPHDTARRLSYLMGIHKALRLLFKEPQRGYDWVRRDNLAFGGRSALDRMLGGDVADLAAVRTYLDAERGGW